MFTQFLREQAARHEAVARAGKAVVDDWRMAIQRLFDQMRAWLRESDPDGIIKIEMRPHELAEEGLGRYLVPRMDLTAFGKWVGIIPKARNTIASAQLPQKAAPERALGRVDITDEIRRYVLYRFPQEGADDVWMFEDLRSEPKPLEQQTFETALMSYFR
jgi:hypothetical protein